MGIKLFLTEAFNILQTVLPLNAVSVQSRHTPLNKIVFPSMSTVLRVIVLK